MDIFWNHTISTKQRIQQSSLPTFSDSPPCHVAGVGEDKDWDYKEGAEGAEGEEGGQGGGGWVWKRKILDNNFPFRRVIIGKIP